MPHSLEPGSVLGRYRLVSRLGAGAFCETWLAEHVQAAGPRD